MSFSITFKASPDLSVTESFEAADIPNKEAAVETGGVLLQAALLLADDVAGEVAKADETVQVSISGHWNGDLGPKAGWASNALTISVTQIYNPEP
jgi:hypothetical protein